MIPARVVGALAATQLIGWGVTFYAVGLFGERMVADTGWSRATVHGGMSLALVVMGIVSPWVGRWIDRAGGRAIMTVGSLLSALGLVGLALAHHLATWFAAWVVLGVSMRMTLYDAAFAALVRIDPATARRALSHVALAGGLASTVFWFVGELLAERLGWRGATMVYAVFALATAPLHLLVPKVATGPGHAAATSAAPLAPPLARDDRERRTAALLFAVMVVATATLASALAAHVIGLLAALGVAGSTAVWVATTRDIGQSAARLAEVASGGRLHPLDLTVLACALLPLTLAVLPFAGVSVAAAFVFAVGGGMGNGLVTVARGALPLVLFDPTVYGALTGRLGAPAFWASALAPVSVAAVLDRWGATGAIVALAVPAIAAAAAALALRLRFPPGRASPPADGAPGTAL